MTATSSENVSRYASRVKFRYLIGLLVLGALPFITTPLLANEVVLFAIFAIGYNLLAGYGGELSLGHAGILGAGSYSYIFVLEQITTNFYGALVLAALVGGVVGMLFALISLQRRGIYFAMITLALSQTLFFLSISFNDITGGRDGISPPTEISSAIGGFEPTAEPLHLYFLSLVLLITIWLITYRIINSPFGNSLMAIRENEQRAVHLGYEPNRVLTIAFTLSGFISGLAGGLYVAVFVYITSNVLHWSISGDVLLMTIMGGFGSLNGPAIGAVAFVLLSHYVVEVIDYWEMLFGALIMVFILFLPGGFVQLSETVTDRIKRS